MFMIIIGVNINLEINRTSSIQFSNNNSRFNVASYLWQSEFIT